MAQQIVAIDLGRERAYVALIEASLRRAVLRGVKTIALAPDLPAAEAWRQVRAELPASLDSVVVGVDGRLVSARALDFPFGDLRKAQSAVGFELEGQIPYAIEDVVQSTLVTEAGATRVQMLAITTPLAPPQQQLTAMAEAGIEPRALALPAAALAEYMPAGGEAATGILSLGQTTTHLAIHRGGLRFVRTLRTGGDDVDRILGRAMGLALPEARAWRHEHGRLVGAHEPASAEARQHSQQIQAALRPLVAALTTTFRAQAQGDMPARLLLTGGLSRLPGLAAALQATFNIPVELLDVHAASASLLGGVAPAVGPEHALALAMAMSLFRHGRELPLNLRRGRLAYQGDIQLYRGQLIRAAVGLGLVLVLAVGAAAVRYSTLVAEGHDLDRGFVDATKRIVGREIRDPTAALATLRQAPGAEGAVIPSFSAASLLEMMSKAIGTEVDVQFDELDLRVDATAGQPERLTGRGEAASFEATEQLRNMLRRDVCVREAEVSKLRKTHNGGRVEFSLALKVACPAGVQPGSQQTALPAASGHEGGDPAGAAPAGAGTDAGPGQPG